MKHCERVGYMGLIASVLTGIMLLVPANNTYAQTKIAANVEQFIPNMFLVHADVAMDTSNEAAGENKFCRNVGVAFSFGSDGYLVTLDCVVRDAEKIYVKSHEGYKLPAELIGTSETNRISVLKTDKSAAHVLPTSFLGGDAAPKSDVVILCREDGDVHQHVGTVGTVRPPDGTFIVEAVAPRAVSGSPVFSPDGRLLGLLALQIDHDSSTEELQNQLTENPEEPLSFVVIPSEYVWVVAQSMINAHNGGCGWLGVSSDIVTPGNSDGITVRSVVEGSPAEKSGLKTDDHIIGVNGAEIPTFRHLIEQLSATQAGETIEITYRRGKEIMTVDVTLAPYPSRSN